MISLFLSLVLAADHTHFIRYDRKIGQIEKDGPYLRGIETVEMPKLTTQATIQGGTSQPTDPRLIKYWEMVGDWAGAAYCSPDSIVTWTCGKHCEGATVGTKAMLYFSISSYEAVGWVGVQKDGVDEWGNPMSYIIVSYRGSEGLTNWIQNLKFARADVPWDPAGNASNTSTGHVHLGFLQTFQASEDLVTTMVKDLLTQYPSYTLLITGHSLGAAVATLAASRFKRILGPSQPIRVVTFESPRVGDEAFAALLNADYGGTGNFIRVTNRGDPVVHLPPTWVYFKHCTREVYQAFDNQTYTCDPLNGEDPTCADSNLIATDISAHLYAWSVQFGWPCPVGQLNRPALPNPDCRIVIN